MYILGANSPCPSVAVVRENLENLAAAGYQTCYFDGDVFNRSDTELRDIVSIAADLNIARFSAHNLHIGYGLYRNEVDVISANVRRFEQASLLGVRYLTCHFAWESDPKGTDWHWELKQELDKKEIQLDDYRKRNVDLLRTLCRKAKTFGLSLTIETLQTGVGCAMSSGIEALLAIIKEVDEPNLGICLDSGHMNIGGNAGFYTGILSADDLIFETHFHDNYGPLGIPDVKENHSIHDLHQPLGIGNINWLAIIAGLEEIKFQNPVVFEIGCDLKTLEINRTNWDRNYRMYKDRFEGKSIFRDCRYRI